jgi:hypothetical protein
MTQIVPSEVVDPGSLDGGPKPPPHEVFCTLWRVLARLTCGPSAGRTWRVTLQREKLCVAVTGLTLALDEIEFADTVLVPESEEDQTAIGEAVFAARRWSRGIRWQDRLDE